MKITEFLRGVELFEGLSDDELEQIAALFVERRFTRGEVVAHQGAPGDELFLITEGFVEVAVDSTDGDMAQVVVNLGAGQIIGEMSLVDQGPRSATVRAISEPTAVQVIRRGDFEALCRENTQIGYIVMRNIAADLSFKLRHRHLSR